MPNPHKEEIKQLLREGKTPEECATLFPITERAVYRYLKEIQDEREGKAPAGKRTGSPTAMVAGVSKEAYTPLGTVAPAPAATVSGTQEFLTIGIDRMPFPQMGYSELDNLLIVASTYKQAMKEYEFDEKTLMGDFCAYLCQAFRIMQGWDVIGAGYNQKKNEKEAISG